MICLLVVLYQKSVSNAVTLQRLLHQQPYLGRYQLWVWDNSPLPCSTNDQQLLAHKFRDFIYTHEPANSPLSSVYNRVIEQCAADESCHYLVLLDHDTMLPTTYLNQLWTTAKSFPSLILPIITQNGSVRSPQRFTLMGYRPLPLSTNRQISSQGLMAINSGMAINMQWLQKFEFRYPEQLKNYGTDNAFMLAFAKSHESVTLLPEPIVHSLSFFEDGPLAKKVAVFREIRKANRQLRYPWKQKIVLTLQTIASSVKYCLLHKTTAFFRD